MNSGGSHLVIGTLSKRTGCGVQTIRYYERIGVLPVAARSAGGYRLYGNEHLKRLTFIRRARALGFSLGEVRTLLRLADERRRPCAEVRAVGEMHLKQVRAKIADLRTIERVLKDMIARCAEGIRPDCPLIEALYREAPGAAAPGVASGSRRRGREC